jgi:CotS family spore coat protein
VLELSTIPAVAKLAKKFRIQVRKASSVIRGVYRIELHNGRKYALKMMRCPASRLRWIDVTLSRVRTKFPRISWRRPGYKGEKVLWARLGRRRYVLNPWIRGRWPSPVSVKDMKACGMALARFHLAGLSVKVPRKGEFNTLYKWPSDLRAKHVRLKRQILIARRGGFQNSMDDFLKKHGSELLRYANEARRLLRNSSYRSACAKARLKRPLCHGDGGPTNFILNQNGTHLIDFETLRVDLRSYDLYRVIYNSCKDHGWNFRIARALLDGYQQVAKLSRTDFELIKVWLRFPRTTDLLLNLYRRSGPAGKASVLKKMGSALEAERKITRFLRQLDRYAENKGK